MRIFVSPASDVFDAKRRSAQYLRCLSEYGCTPKMKANGQYSDGAEWFDVNLSDRMTPANVLEFLGAVGARGVSIQPGDIGNFVSDPLSRNIVRNMLEKKIVDGAELPVENVIPTVTAWENSTWLSPEDLTEAQEQEAYDAILKQLPDAGTALSNSAAPSRAGSGGLRELLEESDAWLEAHKSENPGSSYEVGRWSVR